MAPILHAFYFQRIDQSTIGLHTQFYLLDDVLRSDVAGSKGQDDLPFRVVGKWQNLFSFPCDFVVLERIGGWDALAVHDHELSIEVDTDVHIVQSMPPFFVDLILEGEFYVAAADFSGVYEE